MSETNWSEYQTATVGAKEETTISAVVRGMQSDFRNDSYWAATTLSKQEIAEQKSAPAVNVETANKASLVINLPSGKIVHPKSILAQFRKTYGKYPEVGLKVTTKLDENGFQKIVLEN